MTAFPFGPALAQFVVIGLVVCVFELLAGLALYIQRRERQCGE